MQLSLILLNRSLLNGKVLTGLVCEAGEPHGRVGEENRICNEIGGGANDFVSDEKFRTARFNASGRKTDHPRFVEVAYNGPLMQENVDVDRVTGSHIGLPEAATNPPMLEGDQEPVKFRIVCVRPLP